MHHARTRPNKIHTERKSINLEVELPSLHSPPQSCGKLRGASQLVNILLDQPVDCIKVFSLEMEFDLQYRADLLCSSCFFAFDDFIYGSVAATRLRRSHLLLFYLQFQVPCHNTANLRSPTTSSYAPISISILASTCLHGSTACSSDRSGIAMRLPLRRSTELPCR